MKTATIKVISSLRPRIPTQIFAQTKMRGVHRSLGGSQPRYPTCLIHLLLSKAENSLHLKKEIWTKWNKAISLGSAESIEINGHGAVGGASEKVDLQTQLAKITESRSQAYKASNKAAAQRHNEKDEEERKAVKAAILAQYQNQGEEVSEDSDEENQGKEDELTTMRNENKEAVAKAETEKRDRCRAAALAKKEKDKEDREKQKKDQEERKKKAHDKASKGERKR